MDEEIKRTEESIKYMNDRFTKLKSLSPMNRQQKQEKLQAPVYSADLFKKNITP